MELTKFQRDYFQHIHKAKFPHPFKDIFRVGRNFCILTLPITTYSLCSFLQLDFVGLNVIKYLSYLVIAWILFCHIFLATFGMLSMSFMLSVFNNHKKNDKLEFFAVDYLSKVQELILTVKKYDNVLFYYRVLMIGLNIGLFVVLAAFYSEFLATVFILTYSWTIFLSLMIKPHADKWLSNITEEMVATYEESGNLPDNYIPFMREGVKVKTIFEGDVIWKTT